jgi:hypothetical protein
LSRPENPRRERGFFSSVVFACRFRLSFSPVVFACRFRLSFSPVVFSSFSPPFRLPLRCRRRDFFPGKSSQYSLISSPRAAFKRLLQNVSNRPHPPPRKGLSSLAEASAGTRFVRSSVIVLTCASFQQQFTFIPVLFHYGAQLVCHAEIGQFFIQEGSSVIIASLLGNR